MTILDGKTRSAKEQAQIARDELAKTLDAIEDKLNVPKRVGELRDRAVVSYRRNSVPFLVAGAAAAAFVIGLVAWAILHDD